MFSRLQQVDAISDVPYYMTITVSGPSVLLNPEATDYSISLGVIEAYVLVMCLGAVTTDFE